MSPAPYKNLRCGALLRGRGALKAHAIGQIEATVGLFSDTAERAYAGRFGGFLVQKRFCQSERRPCASLGSG